MPGGMLLFELLRDDGDNGSDAAEWYVKVHFASQSYEQQRNATDLRNAAREPARQPDQVFVVIPDCTSGPESSCPLADFRALCLGAMRKECVSTVDANALWPVDAPETAGLKTSGIVGVGIGSFVVGAALVFGASRGSRRASPALLEAPLVVASEDTPPVSDRAPL